MKYINKLLEYKSSQKDVELSAKRLIEEKLDREYRERYKELLENKYKTDYPPRDKKNKTLFISCYRAICSWLDSSTKWNRKKIILAESRLTLT